MITAAEALNNLKTVKKEANLFIKEVIEPAIKEVMTNETSVRIPLVDYWYYGEVYKKPENLEISNLAFSQDLSIELTNEITEILKDNGYTVTKKFIQRSTEYQLGHGSFIISWGD